MTPAMVEAVANAITAAIPPVHEQSSKWWQEQLDKEARAAIAAVAAFGRSAPVGSPDEILQQLVPVLRATGGGGYADAIEALVGGDRVGSISYSLMTARAEKAEADLARAEKRLIDREEETDALIKAADAKVGKAERERDDARMARDVEHDVAERMRAKLGVASAQLDETQLRLSAAIRDRFQAVETARMEKSLREEARKRLAEIEPSHPESPERCTNLVPKLDRPIEYLVQKGTEVMLEKLRQNAHKPGWRAESRAHLLTRLREEYMELHDAIVDGNPSAEVWREAADVANLAFMVADHVEMVG
jgi:hypothetical protein